MKKIILFSLLLWTTQAFGQSKSDLLEAWVQEQRQLDMVESLDKVDEQTYIIKFSSLPYEGELRILGLQVDPMNPYYTEEQNISHMGTVDVDLVDAPQDFFQRYQNLYYRWQAHNLMYFNREKNQWIDSDSYQRHMLDSSDFGQNPDNWLFQLLDYWHYIFIAIILYFFFSQIFNSRKVDKSLAIQQRSVDLQAEAIEKSLRLHKETNEHLKALLDEVRNNNESQ